MGLRSEHGFTLVEVLVSTLMALIVFGLTLTVLEVVQRQDASAIQRDETLDSARNAVDRLTRELRSVAAPSTTSAGALEVAEPYSIIFQLVDPNHVAGGLNTSNMMRARYCLQDTNPTNEIIWLQVKRWTSAAAPAVPTATACPDPSGADWDSSSRLAEHVTNRVGGQGRPLFSYSPTEAPVAQITSVEPTVYIDPSPGGLLTETQLSSAVALRNENRTPIASFTAVQLGVGRQVLLNASESTDPDGLALSYKWWDGATQLKSTAQQFETESLTAGSTHVFKLEVTDPGGLSAVAEQKVKIE